MMTSALELGIWAGHTFVGFNKMSSWTAILVLCVTLSFVISDPVPCKISEADCLKKMYANMYTKIIDGDPALDIEALDPMHHDEIKGKWSALEYTMTNTSVTGFKDCWIEDVKMHPEATLNLELVCPKFIMNGKYEIHGKLLAFPVEGNGDFTITSTKYKISVENVLKIDHGPDGKTYFSIKSFKQTAEPSESVKYDFKNLFNGKNKELADAVVQFSNDNWYAVAKETQDPIFKANIKKIVENFNKYYKKQPIEIEGLV